MTPYYQDEWATIYHADCREVLPDIPPVDLLITDPPYFIPAVPYVSARGAPVCPRTLGDLSILQGYFDMLVSSIPMKSTGTAYVFCDAKSYPVFWRSLSPHFKYVRLLVWDKIVSYNGYTWRHQHELIAWGEGQDAKRVPTGDGDVLRARGVLQKKRLHPAEKPVELIRRLVLKHSGDILDPFMGSGTTLVAAKEEGRKAIGIEIEEKYCEIAANRLAQEVLCAATVPTREA